MLPTEQIYQELQDAYTHFNDRLFDNALPPCLITLQRERRTFGYFSRDRFVSRVGETVDEIALNPGYFGVRTIKESLSTLVHEMVHMWQFHHGKPARRGYHNKEWAAAMEDIGLMPSDTGAEGGRRVGEKMSHYVIPGGAYDVACDELLTQDFVLTWLDRFPPEKPPRPAPPSVPASPDGDDLEDGSAPAPRPAALDDGDDELAAVAGYIEQPPSKPVNRSNRHKYRCPMCGTQVWGKPGLALICGAEGCDHARFDVVG